MEELYKEREYLTVTIADLGWYMVEASMAGNRLRVEKYGALRDRLAAALQSVETRIQMGDK